MKKIAFGLIASIVIPAAVFLLIEVVARLIESYLPLPRQTIQIMRPNASGNGSYRLKPNLDISTIVSGRLAHIKTNSLGMGWKEVQQNNSNGRVRIAFVGDSMTFGLWASDVTRSFVGVFDSTLPSQKFEVLNFGVGGYGLDDSELIIKEEVHKFQPDYVVLCFFNGNDFRDTYLGVDKYKIENGTLSWDDRIISEKVPAEFRLHPETRIRPSIRSRLQALLNHLALYRISNQLPYLWASHSKIGPRDRATFLHELTVDNHFTSFSFWSAAQFPSVAQKAVDVSLATLDRINNYLVEINAQLVIVAIPYEEQVYVDIKRGPNYDLNLPQLYVEKYARDHNVPYLDLLPQLREYVRRERAAIYVEGDIHFNNLGHKVVGDLIAQWSTTWLHSVGVR